MSAKKRVQRHVWESYIELAEDYRHTPKYREIYKLRCQTIERVFADAKEKHAMRYTHLRSLVVCKSENAGDAYFCMHESKKASYLEAKEGTTSFCYSIFLLQN